MRYGAVGRYDDMLLMFARIERECLETDLPTKPRWMRLLVEPGMQAVGRLIAFGGRLVPSDASLALADRLYKVAQGGGPEHPLDPSDPAFERTAGLARRVEEKTGRKPALLCLFAHPPVHSELLYLNVAMIRQAIQALRLIRGGPCRPKLVNAIDAFALDMLPVHEEGVYAGFMGDFHIGLDRMPLERPWPSRALLSAKAWPSVARRLARALRGGGEVVMVPAGGVAATARVFYCAREAAGRICRDAPQAGEPEGIRKRLEAEAPAFKEFMRAQEVGSALTRSLWRAVEAWIQYELLADRGYDAAMRGEPTERGITALATVARCVGWSEAETRGILERFQKEFRRETPFRERFFSYLARSVVRRGRPVVIVPMTYGRPGAIELKFGVPLAMTRLLEGRVEVLQEEGGTDTRDIGEFSRWFIENRFPETVST